MNFDKFRFVYVPPRTLASPVRDASASPASELGPEELPASRSSQLVEKFRKLRSASQYLQEAVRFRTQGLGIELDVSTDPEVSLSLSRLYPDQPDAPGLVDMEMYDTLLTAEVNAMKADLVLDPASSPRVISPLQKADLAAVTRHVEKTFVEQTSLEPHLALLLRSLKGDSVVFEFWSEALRGYPATDRARSGGLVSESSGHLRDLDVSEKLSATFEEAVRGWSIGYAAVYQLMSEVDPMELLAPETAQIVGQVSSRELVQLTSILGSLLREFHLAKLRDLSDGLVNVLFPRLLSESGKMSVLKDQFGSLTTDFPFTGVLGELLDQHRGTNLAAPLYQQLVGVLRDKLRPISGPRELGTGLLSQMSLFASQIFMATTESERKKDEIQATFKKLVDRKLVDLGTRVEVLTHMRGVLSTLQLVEQFGAQAGGAKNAVPAGGSGAAESFSDALRQLNTVSGAVLQFEGNDLVVRRPEMPIPDPETSEILRNGGADIRTSQDLIRVRSEVLNG